MAKKHLKIAAIIQARMTSTRLPGKVMLPLPYGSGIPALEQMILRVRKCRELDSIIIATTKNKSDDKIVRLCGKLNTGCFRGDEKNVLSRYYFAAKEIRADIVVRLTSDCPCIDPATIDRTVALHIKRNYDYTSSGKLPIGMSVEVFSFKALEEAYSKSTKDYEKEHVTPYI